MGSIDIYRLVDRPSSPEPKPGDLLLAAPSLRDPNFCRTAVLMLQVAPDGAIGVILNRPAELDRESLPDWLPTTTAVVAGGPVGTNSVLALGGSDAARDLVSREVAPGLCAIDLGVTPPSAATTTDVRLFVGYAGWGPGQLESELSRDDWAVVPGYPSDVVGTSPERVWWQVLSRQVNPLLLWRTMPPDPRHN